VKNELAASVDASSRDKKKKVGSRFVWVLPVIAGAFFIFLGAVRFSIGGCDASVCFGDTVPSATPAAAVRIMIGLAQEIALFDIFLGALIIGAAWGGLRNGQSWGWYVLLSLFVVGLADMALAINPLAIADTVLVGLGLLLSYGKMKSFGLVGPRRAPSSIKS
jgi:hypothetical protein